MMRGFRLVLSPVTGQLESVDQSSLSNQAGAPPPTLALFAQTVAGEMTAGDGKDLSVSKSMNGAQIKAAAIDAQVVAESQRVFNALLDKRVRMTGEYMLNAYRKAVRAGAALRRKLMSERERRP